MVSHKALRTAGWSINIAKNDVLYTDSNPQHLDLINGCFNNFCEFYFEFIVEYCIFDIDTSPPSIHLRG